MTGLRWGSAIDVGRRRTRNDDRILATGRLFAVADGMGGHAGGDVASLTATEAVKARFGDASDAASLAQAVMEADRAVQERADAEPALRSMGTTMTAVAVVDEDGAEVLALAHIGDSRAYLLRDGELTQLTDDHSVPQELLRAGQLTEAEAAVDPRRNQLTRVLGFGTGPPDMQTVIPYSGDRLLLCSDGLTNEVPDGEIARVLRTVGDPQKAAERLVAMANENGGADNIAVVVIEVVDDDDRARTASALLAAEPARRSGLMSSEERNAQLRQLAGDGDRGSTTTSTGGRRPTATAAAASSGDDWGAPAELDVPSRRITVRTVAFVIGVLLVLGAAVGAVAWYARGAYFVGIDEGRVAIFQGRPGGLLWFDPTVVERTDLTTARLLDRHLDDLEGGKEEPSLAEAQRYVANLRDEIEARRGPEGTTTTTVAGATPPPGTPTTTAG